MHCIKNGDLVPKASVFALAVVTCFILSITADVSYSEPEPVDDLEAEMKQVKDAAARGLASLLKAIPTEDLEQYNFSDEEDLNQATLGNPFRIHTIAPESILEYGPGTSIDEVISPTSVWLFPLTLTGQIRTLLTVDLIDGEWRAVAIGRSGLAQQWASVLESWPPAAGYEHTLVRVFQAKADLAVLSHPGEIKMIPLESARISLGLPEGKTYDPLEVMIMLQEPVQENIESSRSINQEE